MGAVGETPGKVCILCKQDCANRPRVKDQQGRYVCRECLEKRQAAKASGGSGTAPAAGAASKAKAGAADTGDLMSKLIEQSPSSKSEACEKCGRMVQQGAVICTACGYNRASGQTIKSVVRREKAPKGEKAGAGGRKSINLTLNPMVVFVVLVVLFGGLGLMAQSDDTFLAVFLGLSGLFGLGISIWLLVVAFMTSAVDGILCLCLPFYSIYFVFVKCESGMLKACWTVNLLLAPFGFVLNNKLSGM